MIISVKLLLLLFQAGYNQSSNHWLKKFYQEEQREIKNEIERGREWEKKKRKKERRRKMRKGEKWERQTERQRKIGRETEKQNKKEYSLLATRYLPNWFSSSILYGNLSILVISENHDPLCLWLVYIFKCFAHVYIKINKNKLS